jgi:hypothetical protein
VQVWPINVKYIFSNSAEQYRLVQIHIAGTQTSTPYILHTTDENLAGESADAPSSPHSQVRGV